MEGRRTRPNDPERKSRIAAAATRVLAEGGFDALTYRAVADAAGVPLGSASYYFPAKEQLLIAAVSGFHARSTRLYQQAIDTFVAERGPVDGLAAVVEEMTVHRHGELAADYRVYLSLFGRSDLMHAAATWDLAGLLTPHFPRATARLLAFAVEGMLLAAVMEDRVFPAHEVAPLFAAAVVDVPLPD